MYFYNHKELRDKRRALRNNATPEEKMLWEYIRSNLLGYKFRRQHSIGPYIVDFCCPQKRLIIEIDGAHHAENKQFDNRRTEGLAYAGYTVLRFWNSEVRDSLFDVLSKIKNYLDSPPRSPSRIREGRP